MNWLGFLCTAGRHLVCHSRQQMHLKLFLRYDRKADVALKSNQFLISFSCFEKTDGIISLVWFQISRVIFFFGKYWLF